MCSIDKKTTAITVEQMQVLSDQELFNKMSAFAYPSQFEHVKAYEHLLYRMMHSKGKQYTVKGDKTIFTK